jgi:hypothetical protein
LICFKNNRHTGAMQKNIKPKMWHASRDEMKKIKDVEL